MTIQIQSPLENGAVWVDALGVTAGGLNCGALAPPPPLPDAPLVVPLPFAPPVWVEPPVPEDVVPLPPEEVVPPPVDPPLPVTGVDVSGATPWYWACELDWARLVAGATSAKTTTRGRQIRLLMERP